MQTMTVILTLILGVVAVLQGAINRVMAQDWGLASALVLNNFVVLGLGFAFYAAVHFYPEWFPKFFAGHADFSKWSWYYFLPGLCGMIIITGIPFAIMRIGAAEVFVGIVCSQMMTSLVWDAAVEGIGVTWPRVLGVILTIVGVFVSLIKV